MNFIIYDIQGRFGNYVVQTLFGLYICKKNNILSNINIYLEYSNDKSFKKINNYISIFNDMFTDAIKFIPVKKHDSSIDINSFENISIWCGHYNKYFDNNYLNEENIKFYRQFINKSFFNIDKKYDNVVHYRLGDYLSDTREYNVLIPKTINEFIKDNGENAIILSDDIEHAKTLLNNQYEYSENNFIDDFKIIYNAKNILCSCSTFSIIASLLSDIEQINILYPYFKKKYNYCDFLYNNERIKLIYQNDTMHNKVKKYCIYYITTDKYSNYANEFFNSLHNFMPNDYKTVIWLSDNFININVENDKIDIIKKNILDMPWPLIALLKMHYICDNKINGYDGYFYFNANSVIDNMKSETISLISNACIDKFIASNHAYWPLSPDYSQSAFFGGSYDFFFFICKQVVSEINTLLRQHTILEWHDETSLNNIIKKYNNIIREGFMYDENSLCNEKYIKTLANCPHTFIKLKNAKFKKDK